MIRKLRIRFVCINMTIVTAMLLILFGMLLHFTGENLEKQSMGLLQAAAEEWPGPGRPELLPERVRLPWFRVSRGPQGEQILVSAGYEVDQDTLTEILSLTEESGQSVGILKAYSLRFRKLPGPGGEQILFVDISSEVATMRSLVKLCVMLGILSFGAFLMLSILLARWAIRPVEEAWNRQRQFVADASHELKTPLTVIMTNAELLREPGYDAGEKQGFLENIQTMTGQMRFLVERLLDLARVDNGSSCMEFAPLDLSELVTECMLPFEPLYFERELLLEGNVEPGIRVKGSRSHLQQVLEILLDNGVKYTAPGGTVRVSLKRQGGGCLLRVEGPGEPISRTDLENIFRRFYRIDKARHRDGSYGLGLSIAESIVREHGGKIWAESENGINAFFVQLAGL